MSSGQSGSISRILSWPLKKATATIHLAPGLLTESSDLTRELWADHPTLLFGLAPGGVYHASTITDGPVSSYLAFSPLLPPDGESGVFSVVLSPDHSEPPLAATLSCGVRTFLPAATGRLLNPL